MRTCGFYYDGVSSDRVAVELRLAPGLLEIRGQGVDIAAPLSSVIVVESMNEERNVLRFADGGMCVFGDALFWNRVAAAQGKRKGPSLVRRWEKSLKLAAAALLIMAVLLFTAVRYGVPWLSHKVAYMIPPEIEKRLGQETLSMLDKLVFKPSDLPEEDMERLRLVFQDVALEASLGDNSLILFRKGGRLGANALALPSGIVVMTDELVKLAGDDMELASVMAHEAGHVQGRHGLRYLLQNSLTVLVVSAAIGDVAAISSLAATAPTLLINAKYSRDFEREADDATVRYLTSRGISPQKFADMLGRLEGDFERKRKEAAETGKNAEEEKGSAQPKKKALRAESYLSSHPPVEERIRRLPVSRQDGS